LQFCFTGNILQFSNLNFYTEKPQRIADTAIITVVTPPSMHQNITVDITRDVTVYMMPTESATIDFSHAFQISGPNAEWIWIVNGVQKPYEPNSWFGHVTNYNPLDHPKLTVQLKLKNSAGEILSPVITFTMFVPPKITKGLPESITATEGEEIEVSVDIIPERSLITWGVNNKTLPDHTATIKFIPTREMDGKQFGVLVMNPLGAATSVTTLHVKMAPWKIAVIVIFVVLAVGGAVAGGFIFLKKKGYFNNKVEYVNTPKITGEDDDGLLDEDLELPDN
jgi:hypothetical protein